MKEQKSYQSGRQTTRFAVGFLVGLLVVVFSAIASQSTAQTQHDLRPLERERAQQNRAPERRIALVIGNGAYTTAPLLKSPPTDARDMAVTLKQFGFDVKMGINLNQRDMKLLIREFGQKLKAGGTGLFYYAGHGVQSKGRNYLIPIEADIQSEDEVEDAGVDVGLVLNYMDDAQNGLNFVILDACRNNPFARSFRSASDGLAQVDAPTGTLIAYATAPGHVASDGAGQNGLYTSELIKQMRVSGQSVTDMFMLVRAAVIKQTAGKQVPWEASSLVGNFSFNASNAEAVAKSSPASPEQVVPRLGSISEVTSNSSTTSKATAETSKLDLPTALTLLDRSIKARDGSMQGQVEAIESLLARGYEFSSKDLSGVSLRGARIPNGIFKKVRMHAGDLSKVEARGANFADSGLRFVNLEGGIFSEGIFTNVYAPFIWGKDVNFEKANLAEANFFCADLRGANFSNASLRGASFAFADLRGAKFDGADLTGAYLPGAVLDNATFVSATIENTEFTGAVAEKFNLNQKQKARACRHQSNGELVMSIYVSGDSYPFNSILWSFPFSDKSLSLCTTKPLDSYYNAAKDGYQHVIYLDEDSIYKAGRRETLSVRVSQHLEFLKTQLIESRLLKP